MFIKKSKKTDSKDLMHKESRRIISKVFASIMLIVSSALINIVSLAQTNLKPGQTFKDCPDCPEMVVIPSGSFMMGAPPDETGRYNEEGPQRKVSIRKFAAGKFDVTKRQWATFVAETNRTTTGGCAWSGLPGVEKPWELSASASWNHLGFAQDDSHPVVCLTWDDVQDYVRWLSKKTGSNYRLLTESEWEYAARAGTTTPYPWGPGASHEFANYGTDTAFGYGLAAGRDRWMTTSPVGSFPPNAFGLYDMHGNVMQWVEDCFENSYSDLPPDGSAYKVEVILKMTGDLAEMNGKNSCSYRIIRGGDFGDPPRMIRSASRNWAPVAGTTLHNYASSGLGFRVARTL
ncbi:MAG TPA: formylglycine-generating enzyme family protein [Puia sp.]|nr:formylglycine-generating enzyme family protein [Puia sp.]